ncbi:MAG: ECF transporter S component [Candidatus Bathyarchaeia archaeon]
MNSKVIASAAAMTALVYVMTSVSIRMPPPLGVWHIGDVGSFVAGILFGPLVGAFACGIGATMFYVWNPLWGSSFIIWAPPTLIIRSVMGYLLGRFRRMVPSSVVASDLAVMVLSHLWKNLGYFLYDYYLFGAVAFLDLTTFFLLTAVDIAVTIPLLGALRKALGREYLM